MEPVTTVPFSIIMPPRTPEEALARAAFLLVVVLVALGGMGIAALVERHGKRKDSDGKGERDAR